MKKWIAALLVLLAMVVIVSPGIVGRLAEKSVEQSFDFAANESDEVTVTTESFQRGWFTSEGRHRIEWQPGAFVPLVDGGETPSLIVDTRIDHGLVPVSSMSRQSGSLMPALASTISTMKLDPGDGRLIELPGKITSTIGLTGETASRFLLEAGSETYRDGDVEWQGADITVHTNPSTGAVAIDGVAQPWEIRTRSRNIKVGDSTIVASRTRSQYGFGVGNGRLEVGPVEIESKPLFGSLSITANSEIDGDRVNAETSVAVAKITTPALGAIDFTMNIAVHGLDARSSYKLSRVIRNAELGGEADDALAQIYPLIEADLHQLLAAGFEMRVNQLDITVPDADGKVSFTLRLALPETDADADLSWPALLLALSGSADIRVPVQLFEMAKAMNPDAGALVAMGFLKKEGAYYRMQAELAKGLLTINGAPMPVPLGM